MTHPAVFLITIGVAVGVALFAFFANANFQHEHRSRDKSDDESDDDYLDDRRQCTICQEEICSSSAEVYLDCGHTFHRSCIRKWFSIKKQCPNCCRAQQSPI